MPSKLNIRQNAFKMYQHPSSSSSSSFYPFQLWMLPSPVTAPTPWIRLSFWPVGPVTFFPAPLLFVIGLFSFFLSFNLLIFLFLLSSNNNSQIKMPLYNIFYHSLNPFFSYKCLGVWHVCSPKAGEEENQTMVWLYLHSVFFILMPQSRSFQSLLLGKRHASLLPWKLHRRRSGLVLSSQDEKRVSE